MSAGLTDITQRLIDPVHGGYVDAVHVEDARMLLAENSDSGPCGFGWVTRNSPRWEEWGAWSARILVMTSDGPMVVYVPEDGIPEYENHDELADPDEWLAWSEIPPCPQLHHEPI